MYIFFRFFFAIFLFPICFPVVFPRCVSPGGWVQVLGPAFLLTRALSALAEKRLYGSKSSSQTWWTCHSLQIKVWFLLFYNVFFSLFSLLFSSIFNIFPIVFIIVVCFFSWFLSFFEKNALCLFIISLVVSVFVFFSFPLYIYIYISLFVAYCFHYFCLFFS